MNGVSYKSVAFLSAEITLQLCPSRRHAASVYRRTQAINKISNKSFKELSGENDRNVKHVKKKSNPNLFKKHRPMPE